MQGRYPHMWLSAHRAKLSVATRSLGTVAERADALEQFSAPTRAWFSSTFEAPTQAQARGWEAIGSGHHALILAPTGSGKTLAAFLWALDRLLVDAQPVPEKQRCRVLYVSPLKALTYD